MTTLSWLRLSLTTGLGPILIRRLIEHAGSPDAAVNLSPRDLEQIEGIGPAKSRSIHTSLASSAAEAESHIQRARELGAHVLCPDSPAYPPLLRDIPDPPAILFVLGTIEPRDLQALAIVGSRRCSHYGREQAERFGSLLAGAGITVVSGGARGIDSSAHRGALQHPHGRTIAVLGSGLDVVYPPENESLFKQIAQRGAVISELPFGTPPNAENFPRRNRIVSGLSRGVLVIEADDRSGALITARLANEDHNRTVFALPGRVDNSLSSGPHHLIRDGATLVTGLEDILEGLTPLSESTRLPALFGEPHPASPGTSNSTVQTRSPRPDRTAPDTGTSLTSTQRQIIDAFQHQEATVDQLIDRTTLDASVILRDLTLLSLKGQIKRLDGQTYTPRLQ